MSCYTSTVSARQYEHESGTLSFRLRDETCGSFIRSITSPAGTRKRKGRVVHISCHLGYKQSYLPFENTSAHTCLPADKRVNKVQCHVTRAGNVKRESPILLFVPRDRRSTRKQAAPSAIREASHLLFYIHLIVCSTSNSS